MPVSKSIVPQDYPRIQDKNSPDYGCLDDSKLIPHTYKIPSPKLKEIILAAISNANKKSSREMLSIPAGLSEQEEEKLYIEEGKKLFHYFRKYIGDPAATAHQIKGKHYAEVAKELFRNRALQKERMNSGWRYQFLALDCAQSSKRFRSVSDIGTAEGDFNAVIEFRDKKRKALTLYVSVKNRSSTMGGQDWPKAIHALENLANADKNRVGPYCCVFGIAMERGFRIIKTEQKGGKAHSVNTELWLSDFFWQFFANYSYEEIMIAVLEILMEMHPADKLSTEVEIPEKLLESFGDSCRSKGLLDKSGYFNDPYKLVQFFCRK